MVDIEQIKQKNDPYPNHAVLRVKTGVKHSVSQIHKIQARTADRYIQQTSFAKIY